MKEKKYGYEVEIYHLPADMGGGLMATIPELPGCVGVGYTNEEVLASVSSAADKFRQLSSTGSQAGQTRMSVDELFSYSDLTANELIALTE